MKIQIIVTRELPPDENLYLCCLTDHLTDVNLMKRLADDYGKHSEQEIYINYLEQLTNANAKGESQMLICEGLFNLYGTSSEEIIAKTKMEAKIESKRESDEYYLPKINELSSSIEELISQNNYLKKLLQQNNISFD